jgi:hypothetical protein
MREGRSGIGMDGDGNLGSVPVGGRDWAVVAGRGEVGHLSLRGNMRLGSLFCDVRLSPKDNLKAILITNLGFLVENLPPTVL